MSTETKESIVQDKYLKAFPATIPGRKEPVKREEFEASPRSFPTLKYVLKDPESIYTRIDADQEGINWVEDIDGVTMIELNLGENKKKSKKGGRPAAPKNNAKVADELAAKDKEIEATKAEAEKLAAAKDKEIEALKAQLAAKNTESVEGPKATETGNKKGRPSAPKNPAG